MSLPLQSETAYPVAAVAVAAAAALADVQQLVQDAEQQVILYCSQGGLLEPNEAYRKGWQTR
jgi:uncharacterized NAD-dependent epimerase/dehydratase family protein